MRALMLAMAISVIASPVWANARITVLMDVLQVREVVEIFRAEGIIYAQELDVDFLDGQGGAFWAAQVRRIYDAQRISEQVRAALETGLSDAEVEAAIAFFGSPDGSRIIALENAARRAMGDPEIESAAREIYQDLAQAEDPQVDLVRAYIEVNDLLERNVSGAMSANYHFYMGLSEGGYDPRSEAVILDDVWSQQEAIRTDTEDWLYGFLLMAYQPVAPDVLQGYVDYSASPPGQALNAALFAGFDAMYLDVSYGLGRALALSAKGDEI